MECWPRGIDVTASDAEQYPGWPITIDQSDNYDRTAMAYLPTLKFGDAKKPVIQIIDETYGDVVYTVRVPSDTYQPKVFRDGTYTIRIIDGESVEELTGIEALRENSTVVEIGIK